MHCFWFREVTLTYQRLGSDSLLQGRWMSSHNMAPQRNLRFFHQRWIRMDLSSHLKFWALPEPPGLVRG